MKNCTYILLLIIVLFTSASCTFSADDVYTDDTTEQYQLYDYYIDEYGNEGIVAYMYGSKSTTYQYILVISLDEAFLPWGPMGEKVYKATDVSHTTLRDPAFGVAMLQAMTSIGIQRYPAQEWCNKMNSKEQLPRAGSWRLPSYYELRLIFGEDGENLQSLNNALNGVGGKLISKNNMYWTCVEDFDNYITINNTVSDYDQDNRAIITSPENTTYGNKDRWLKKNHYFVRAIKYVYYRHK